MMLVYRWQSPVIPDVDQVRLFFEREGLFPIKEIYPTGKSVQDHSHPFDEVRMICKGEMFFNVAGNSLLLRGGDRIIIPSNTRHCKKAQRECISFCAYKPY